MNTTSQQVTSGVEFMEPEVARWALSSSPGNPRWRTKAVNRQHVEFFKTHIENGTFEVLGHIMFDELGRLKDGHHRLTAIAESGVGQWVNVLRNVPVRVHPDTGVMVRGEHQQAVAIGMVWVTSEVAAAAKVMRAGMDLGGNGGKLNIYQSLEFAKRHKDALLFATGLFATKRRGVTIAPVYGIFARAYYHVDHDLLREFAEVLINGISTKPEHEVIINLRDKLIGATGSGLSSGVSQASRYAVTLRALQAFVRGERLKKLFMATSDDFFLPE